LTFNLAEELLSIHNPDFQHGGLVMERLLITAALGIALAGVTVTVNNDHFNTFFFDNWPTFSIGIAEATAASSV
jgi:hypothetical protein